ncbi:tetratricopeptide repeat protein [Alkalicoccus luteus]|uniref:Tetratricopeptide repeat protein n=1 Tax=Alkalicoccus luteus TaxID=1237094 RepID=A0A969PPW0_9BACI|nr:tetratricopeptide repeat protein [Alkalicoccus luteus]NJP38201.1 tetratricopeptide repeat protein [Alkalicoccus luteus]
MNEELRNIITRIENGEHEEALTDLEQLTREADDETKRTAAELYFELGLVDRALPIVEELLFNYPENGELFAFASECYMELGREQEALDMLNEIDSSDKAYLQARLLLADLYESEGLEEVAEQKLLEAKEVMPEEPLLQLGLGEFYLNRGDYQTAVSWFRKAVLGGKLPDDLPINPHVRLAEAYSAAGQFEEAVDHYKSGMEKEETADGLFGLGVTSLQLERYTDAADALEKLIEQDPDYTTAYSVLGRVYIAVKRWEEAAETLKQGIARDEYNEELYLQMARLQLSRGEEAEGRSFLSRVIAMNPSNVSAVKEALYLYEERGDYEEVLDLIRFLDEYNEFDPLYEWFRAKALFEEDDVSGAAQAVDAAFSDGSGQDDSLMLEEAADIYFAAGRTEKALASLKAAFAADPDRVDLEAKIEDVEDRLRSDGQQS